MEATQTLHFYTTGEAFSNLLYNFIGEGSYATAYKILEDCDMNRHQIKEVFSYRAKFHGDSRDDSMSLELLDERTISEEEFNETLMTGIRTAMAPHNYDEDNEHFGYYQLERASEEIEDIKYLLKVFTIDEIFSRTWQKMLRSEGYSVLPFDTEERVDNAVVLQNGMIVPCSYMDHINLYPILSALNLASSSDWTSDEWTIHVSSRNLSGDVVRELKFPSTRNEGKLTKEQLQTILAQRKQWRKSYGEFETVIKDFYDMVRYQEDHGGKYAGLVFLQKAYHQYKIPRFSKSPIDSVKNCLRTSPLRSIPGLLESVFDINENSVKEMEETFEKYKDVIPGNRFHYFYQEYIEGMNGVFTIGGRGEEHDFEYSVSPGRGDVVKGKNSNIQLSGKVERRLMEMAMDLFDDIQEPLQCEFVITPKDIYLVQFRLLPNSYETTAHIPEPREYVAKGKTFSKGIVEAELNEILIVDSEADSKDLLGKKALIVKEDVSFSHILALSQMLEIPSIYATGDFEIPQGSRLKVIAYNKDAFITKIDAD